MKYALLGDVLNYTWDQLTAVFWQRYPNPKSTHVLAEDTFHRELRKDGTLFSKRIIKKRNSVKIPSWGERIAPKYVYVVEESVVDPTQKTITTYTRNVSSTSFLMVDEKCLFRPDADPSKLYLQREVFIKSSMRFIGSAIQSIGYSRYKGKTSVESLAGFNYVLAKRFRPWELQEESQTPAVKAKELLKESKEKIIESTEKLKESKEKLLESKEKFKESKEKLKESAQHARERSKETLLESREKMKEKAQEAAKMAKDRTPVFADPVK